MTFKKLVMGGVAAAVLASSAVANAGEIEANVALSTDYIFRGISQTNNDPAISGGFDYSFGGGFYVGAWASNVDFGSNLETVENAAGETVLIGETSSASTEIDLYAGYVFELAENVELDLGYIYYTYPGDSSSLNYSEFAASISFSDLAFGLTYSPDYFGSDEDAIIFDVDYSVGIAKNLSLDLHAGYTTTDLDETGASILIGDTDLDDYVEWSVGLSTAAVGVDFSLTYHDTDIDSSVADVNDAEDRVVFSIGKSF